jgi:very-short-patch-repair endonuclease
MAIKNRLTDRVGLNQYCAARQGHPGIKRLRALATLGAPAESPMETRLRWLLMKAGLPSPEVQVDLHDNDGRFLGRVDLYYSTARLAIEYDGDNHRDRFVEDNRRQNLLLSAGFSLLRFTASDIYRRPDTVAALVKGTVDAKRAEFSRRITPLTSNGRN